MLIGPITTSIRQAGKLKLDVRSAQDELGCVSRMLGMPGLLESYTSIAYSTRHGAELWKANGVKKSRVQPIEKGLEQSVWAQLSGSKSRVQQQLQENSRRHWRNQDIDGCTAQTDTASVKKESSDFIDLH